MKTAVKPAARKETSQGTEALLLAQVLPNPSGGYSITPKRPLREVCSKDAARLLGVSRSTLSKMVRQKIGRQLLKWRWTTSKKGKRLFDMEGIMAYRHASSDSEFGGAVNL